MLSVKTTLLDPDTGNSRGFEPNMFTTTRAFALTHPKGRARVDTAELSPGGPRVSRVQSTGHFVDLIEETAITAVLPRAGRLRIRVTASEYRITPQGGLLFPPNARRTLAEAAPGGPPFRAVALMCPHARVRERLNSDPDAAGVWRGLADGLAISAAVPGFVRLSGLIDCVTTLFDDPGAPVSRRTLEAFAVLMDELLCGILVETSESLREVRHLPAALRRVRLAEEIMRERSDEPLAMSDIAREVGVGLRSLQLAFTETRAMGPRDMLNRMRMERARERLLTARPDETVTAIALDCGFMHLSRFAGAYREAYGESPQATLARVRRRF